MAEERRGLNFSFSRRNQWFAASVQVHAGDLRAWLQGKFPGVGDPDNLVQEALLRVWRAAENEEISSPRALLFTTARNLALDQLRRNRVVAFEPLAEGDESSVLGDEPSGADVAAKNQELEILTQAIQSLPDRCRQVLTLRKIYGLSQRDIAAQLGITENTVETQIAHGMRRCAEFLAKHGLP